MGNKSIGTNHENRSAAFWQDRLGFPDVFVKKDNSHMHDLGGGPFPIECKKRKAWSPQKWARDMEAEHGPEWFIHVEHRDLRPKDAPPKVLMMSEPALVRLREEWSSGRNLTATQWLQLGLDQGYIELKDQ